MDLKPALVERRVGGVTLEVDDGARAHGLLVAFTDRRGGVSRPPYDSLNLAARVGDDAAAVQRNRGHVADALGFDAGNLALARQVHGAELIEVGAGDSGVLGEADGLVARNGGPVLSILTADCAPVVIAGDDRVAIVHAGWRGLVAGVVERGVEAVAAPGVGGEAVAWIGPCIHACCYEVGPEVVAAFGGAGLPVAAPDRVDPSVAAHSALRRAGVERIAASSSCTSCNAHYFSYRRDGITGRQGAFVGLVG